MGRIFNKVKTKLSRTKKPIVLEIFNDNADPNMPIPGDISSALIMANEKKYLRFKKMKSFATIKKTTPKQIQEEFDTIKLLTSDWVEQGSRMVVTSPEIKSVGVAPFKYNQVSTT